MWLLEVQDAYSPVDLEAETKRTTASESNRTVGSNTKGLFYSAGTGSYDLYDL